MMNLQIDSESSSADNEIVNNSKYTIITILFICNVDDLFRLKFISC
jgi:hypothetical protein